MKTRLIALFAAVSAAIAPLMSGADKQVSIEERLQRIEAQLERLESRLADTVSADELAPALKEFSDLTRNLGWDGKAPLTVVKAMGKEQKLALGGYVQMQAEAGDAPDSRFNGVNDRVLLRRARLGVKASFAEHFELTLQSEFGNNAIGGVSGYRAQLADAFVAWNKYDYATVQVGQFKTPFGYEQLQSDLKGLLIERSLPNDMLTVGRQIGVGVQGVVAEKKLNYSVGAFNGNGTNNGNNDNDHFMYAGRVAGQIWAKNASKVSVGANAFSSRDTGNLNGYRFGWGVDGQLTVGRVDLLAEYLSQKTDRKVGLDTTADGWSVLAAYFVVPKVLQTSLRYEVYDSNVDTRATTSDSWVVGMNYLLKGDDLKLSLNYILGDPAGPLSDQGRLLGRLQVVF